jgi:hypothetical protein
MNELAEHPDWFDRFWEQHSKDLPIFLRGQKKAARHLLGAAVEAMGAYAQTPDGVQKVVAFAKIARIVIGARGVLGSPDPSPNEVVAEVQRLVDQVKP